MGFVQGDAHEGQNAVDGRAAEGAVRRVSEAKQGADAEGETNIRDCAATTSHPGTSSLELFQTEENERALRSRLEELQSERKHLLSDANSTHSSVAKLQQQQVYVLTLELGCLVLRLTCMQSYNLFVSGKWRKSWRWSASRARKVTDTTRVCAHRSLNSLPKKVSSQTIP